MLRDEVAKYTELSGNDGEHTPIGIIGAYLDGYDKGLELSALKGFDGMTNGEVMNLILRKTFPRMIFIRGINEWNKTKSIVYAEEWENAPYKAER